MKRLIAVGLFAFSICCFAGCGSDEPTNMMEGVDEQALADYEAMIEADEAMMNEDPGDVGDDQ